MHKYIVLLRGINVSGQKKVPMAELRELLTKCEFKEVQTYIQTGNVIVCALDAKSDSVEAKIQRAIQSHFGFEVSVLVRTPEAFKTIFDACPFNLEQKEKGYFTILHTIPDTGLVDSTSKEVYPNETFVITKDCVYFYSKNGYGRAKCNNNFFERKLKVSATTRNYKTMLKLLSLAIEN